jgi:hypothetical protein
VSDCVRGGPTRRWCKTHETYYEQGRPYCRKSHLSTGHHSPSRVTVITEAGMRACGVEPEPELPVIIESALVQQRDGSWWRFRHISEQPLPK